MNIPQGIGHIGEKEYENELQALVSGVKVDCECCGKEYFLKGGMQALLDNVHQDFICEECVEDTVQ